MQCGLKHSLNTSQNISHFVTNIGDNKSIVNSQMWSPPTPPHDENDVYIDETLCFLYEPTVMPESRLPPIYVKKEHKRIRLDPVLGTAGLDWK